MGVVLLVITSNGGVVDSNVTRSRADRAQLSVLLDAGLVSAVRVAAKGQNMSIAGFVERALEVMVDGDIGVGSGCGACSSPGGAGAGQERGRDRVDDPVESSSQRVDWDRVLAEGISRKAAAPWSVAEAVADSAVNPYRLDPIEEIA